MLDAIDGEVLTPEYTDDYMDEYSIGKILNPTQLHIVMDILLTLVHMGNDVLILDWGKL